VREQENVPAPHARKAEANIIAKRRRKRHARPSSCRRHVRVSLITPNASANTPQIKGGLATRRTEVSALKKKHAAVKAAHDAVAAALTDSERLLQSPA
jgi:hypothetical protein